MKPFTRLRSWFHAYFVDFASLRVRSSTIFMKVWHVTTKKWIGYDNRPLSPFCSFFIYCVISFLD